MPNAGGPPSEDIISRARDRALTRSSADDATVEGAALIDRVDRMLRAHIRRAGGPPLPPELGALERSAAIDVMAPVASRSRPGRLVKILVARSVGWYVGHVAAQSREHAQANLRVTRALATRLSDLEARLDEDAPGSSGRSSP